MWDAPPSVGASPCHDRINAWYMRGPCRFEVRLRYLFVVELSLGIDFLNAQNFHFPRPRQLVVCFRRRPSNTTIAERAPGEVMSERRRVGTVRPTEYAGCYATALERRSTAVSSHKSAPTTKHGRTTKHTPSTVADCLDCQIHAQSTGR